LRVPPRPPLFPYTTLFRSKLRSRRVPRQSERRDDAERERDPAAILGSQVAVAGPPVDRVFDEALDPEPGRREGGDDLTERPGPRSEEHTSELQSLAYLVCR